MTANSGMRATKAISHSPRSDMNPGEAIAKANADKSKARTSEPMVLRLLLREIPTKAVIPLCYPS